MYIFILLWYVHIHIIVVAYLREAAVDYYKKIKNAIIQQAKGNAIANLKDLLIIQFASDSTKDI